MQENKIVFNSKKPNKVHHDGCKPTNSLVCTSHREIEANVNLVVQFKERLEAP